MDPIGNNGVKMESPSPVPTTIPTNEFYTPQIDPSTGATQQRITDPENAQDIANTIKRQGYDAAEKRETKLYQESESPLNPRETQNMKYVHQLGEKFPNTFEEKVLPDGSKVLISKVADNDFPKDILKEDIDPRIVNLLEKNVIIFSKKGITKITNKRYGSLAGMQNFRESFNIEAVLNSFKKEHLNDGLPETISNEATEYCNYPKGFETTSVAEDSNYHINADDLIKAFARYEKTMMQIEETRNMRTDEQIENMFNI